MNTNGYSYNSLQNNQDYVGNNLTAVNGIIDFTDSSLAGFPVDETSIIINGQGKLSTTGGNTSDYSIVNLHVDNIFSYSSSSININATILTSDIFCYNLHTSDHIYTQSLRVYQDEHISGTLYSNVIDNNQNIYTPNLYTTVINPISGNHHINIANELTEYIDTNMLSSSSIETVLLSADTMNINNIVCASSLSVDVINSNHGTVYLEQCTFNSNKIGCSQITSTNVYSSSVSTRVVNLGNSTTNWLIRGGSDATFPFNNNFRIYNNNPDVGAEVFQLDDLTGEASFSFPLNANAGIDASSFVNVDGNVNCNSLLASTSVYAPNINSYYSSCNTLIANNIYSNQSNFVSASCSSIYANNIYANQENFLSASCGSLYATNIYANQLTCSSVYANNIYANQGNFVSASCSSVYANSVYATQLNALNASCNTLIASCVISNRHEPLSGTLISNSKGYSADKFYAVSSINADIYQQYTAGGNVIVQNGSTSTSSGSIQLSSQSGGILISPATSKYLTISYGNNTSSSNTGLRIYVDSSGESWVDSKTFNGTNKNLNIYGEVLYANGASGLNLGAGTGYLTVAATSGFKLTTKRMTNDGQPCFGAAQSGASANATGDGTMFLCPCNTELFDQNSNYDNTAGNYSFTAPVAGKYFFTGNMWSFNFGAAHNAYTGCFFKNGTQITCFYCNPYYLSTGGYFNVSFSKILSLAVNDVIQLKGAVGGSTKTVSIDSSWGGHLLC